MMKMRIKRALPEKIAANLEKIRVHKSWALPLHYPLDTCVIKKVVIIQIPFSCVSEVLAGKDIFLIFGSNRQKFYNKLLSFRIAITIKM